MAGFHFNRIVTYRNIFFCVETISSTLVLRKQRNTIRFGTIRLKWKPALKLNVDSHKKKVQNNSFFGVKFTLVFYSISGVIFTP